ncbi:hypothetical protein ACFL4Y_03345 [Gemmatimonadota bacterium]
MNLRPDLSVRIRARIRPPYLLSLMICAFSCALPAHVATGALDFQEAPPSTVVRYRIEGREELAPPGSWVPADADLLVAVGADRAPSDRAYRLEVLAHRDGERTFIEVPEVQEYEKATRKWIHVDLSPAQAIEGRWIWAGTFRPGDVITFRWRDADSGQILPHPVTLRFVENFGARLAFATPVSVVFPVSGGVTAAASAGFAVRYYRISNRPFWRTMDRVGFPSVGFAYAEIAGEKSMLYALGLSAIDDQLHIYYGGFRNKAAANNFWMVGFSLRTKDLMAAVKRAIR